MVQVSFDNLTVSLEDVQNRPARYARQLERAKKSPGYVKRTGFSGDLYS